MRRTTALQRAQTTCAQTAGTLVKKKAKYEPNITLVTLKLKLVFLKCFQFYQTVTPCAALNQILFNHQFGVKVTVLL